MMLGDTPSTPAIVRGGPMCYPGTPYSGLCDALPPSVPPATPVAGSPQSVTWDQLDAAVLQLAGFVPADLSPVDSSAIMTACSLCADPRSALTAKLANTPLASGVTIDAILARYASNINTLCARFQAEATKRNLGVSCGAAAGAAAPSGFSLSSVSPVLLIGGGLLVAALLMGDK